jgi:hypothetical protein
MIARLFQYCHAAVRNGAASAYHRLFDDDGNGGVMMESLRQKRIRPQ